MLKHRRSAFTLIELLVVIAIMTALAALTVGASFRAMETAQVSNTQSALDRVQSVLLKNWSAVKEQALREHIENDSSNPQHDTYGWIYQNFCKGIDEANTAARVRLIYVKLKLRQAFPMDVNQALYAPYGNVDHLGLPNNGPCPAFQLQALASYVTYMKSHGVSLGSGFSYESSACLLMALQNGVGGTSMDPDKLTSGGAGGVDNQGYNLPVLNDAWGRPIYFSRVPAGCPITNPPTSVSVTTMLGGGGGVCYAMPFKNPWGIGDANDPNGYLQSPVWKSSLYAGLLQSNTLELIAPSGYFYVLGPMVASGGPGKDNQPCFHPVTFAPKVNTSGDYVGRPLYANP